MPKTILVELPFAYRAKIRRQGFRIPSDVGIREQVPFAIPMVEGHEAPVATRLRFKPESDASFETRTFAGRAYREVLTSQGGKVPFEAFLKDMTMLDDHARPERVRMVPNDVLPALPFRDFRMVNERRRIRSVLDMSMIEPVDSKKPSHVKPVYPKDLRSHEMLETHRSEDLASATEAYATSLFALEDGIWTANEVREPVWSVMIRHDLRTVQVLATRRHDKGIAFRADRRVEAQEFAMREAERLGWGFEHTTAEIECVPDLLTIDDVELGIAKLTTDVLRAMQMDPGNFPDRQRTEALWGAPDAIKDALQALADHVQVGRGERVRETWDHLRILHEFMREDPDSSVSRILARRDIPSSMRKLASERERRHDIWIPEEVAAFSP